MDDGEFKRLMAQLGPFEPAPLLAVAVSGGPDSLALCLLAARWAGALGGTVLGLIVDHGLRPGSAEEARTVAGWLGRRGIAHQILTWTGVKPTSGLQAAARAARYELLTAACVAAGSLHLLLAHQQEDQAETVRLRQARQSGKAGLAAMAPIRETAQLRLLRPLLAVPKARLAATLRRSGQPWLEDPSNQSLRFARGRLRQEAAAPEAALAIARAAGAERAEQEQAVAAWLAQHVHLRPAGYATLPLPAFATGASTLVGPALARLLMMLGGHSLPPRGTRLARLLAALRAADPSRPAAGIRTLAGCWLLPWRGRWLVCREPAAVAGPRPLLPGRWCGWDGRFALRLAEPAAGGLAIGALGEAGRRRWRELAGPATLPGPVLPSLPAVWSGDRLLQVPHWPSASSDLNLAVLFQPEVPLAPAAFCAHWGSRAMQSVAQTVALGSC